MELPKHSISSHLCLKSRPEHRSVLILFMTTVGKDDVMGPLCQQVDLSASHTATDRIRKTAQ